MQPATGGSAPSRRNDFTLMPFARGQTATMGVAATFSRQDAEQNGVVIGREARALGIDVVLQPFINIDRDITFARAYNTFGEDPYLSGVMGAAEVQGAQSQDVVSGVSCTARRKLSSPSVVGRPLSWVAYWISPCTVPFDARCGKSNPGGHLPMTWAKQLTDYAANDPAHAERSANGVDGKTTYSEGVLVGYRWFDSQKIQPQFPFGLGLSYTQFELTDLHGDRNGEGGATVTVKVRNAGKVAGDAVPQVYLERPASDIAGAQFAPRTLAAFDRVSLAPGESKIVTLTVAPRAFQYWATATNAWATPPGVRALRAGFSSGDLPLTANLP